MQLKLYPKRSGGDGRDGHTTLNLIALHDNDGKYLKFLPHSPWLLELISNQLITIPDAQYELLVSNYKKDV